ncbi:tetratricopeptide repeat protein [Thalassolituus sp. LLYu03]|uniref:tetratricopeptide repeat protein n=1 Tax=Thalassolituus sp. LLYu03 TaxID=3421656 RepID=UPI003D264EF2
MKKPITVIMAGLLSYGALLAVPVTTVQVHAEESTDNQAAKPRVKRTQTLRPVIFKKLDAVRALADEKKYAEALDELNAVEKIRRNSYEQAMTHNMFAYVYFNQENYKGAIGAYNKVLATDGIPDSLEQTTRYSVAKLYLMQEDYKSALTELNKWFAIVEKPGAEAYILRAQIQFQLEQYNKALPDVKKAIAMIKEQGNLPKENWLMLERAVYYQNKDFKSLARCLQDLATLYPKPQYWVQLAAVYSELSLPKKELATLETAYDQKFLTKENELISYAQALLGQEIPVKAAAVLEKGMKDDIVKPNAKNLSLLGDAWMLAKEYDKAIDVMGKAAKESGKGMDFFKLAQIHTERQEWKLALQNVEAALKAGDLKEPSQAYILKGLVLFNLDDLPYARDTFEQAHQFAGSEKMADQWLKYIDGEQKRREYMAEAG